ncbi:MAG: DUF2225 domain-containing protein [Planctomycetota bacterium]
MRSQSAIRQRRARPIRWARDSSALLALLLCCFLSQPTSATTWRSIQTTCPIDGSEVKGHIPGSTFIPGTTPDFRPQGVGVDLFLASMLTCPTCGFTTSADRFEDAEGLDKAKIKQALEALDAPALFAEIDAAIVVEANWTARPKTLARLHLGAKWLADDTGEPAVIAERLEQAVASHLRVLDDPELTDDERPAVTYLVGELLRQQGKNEQALQWFEKARTSAEEDLITLIAQQAALAEQGDDPPAIEPTELKDAPAAKQLASIRLLRERDDGEAIKALKDICLTCPPELREAAIDALIGEAPRAIHLPIYLEAIGNDHFRTVQSAARAVQHLRASEAAPLIVEALKNPVDSTEYRLWSALAATATENELPFLKQQLDAGEDSDRILMALVNTRSEKAIPLIRRAADATGYSLIYIDDDPADLETLRAFAPELRNVLPDLREFEDDTGQANLKIMVLSVLDDATSAEELAAAVSLDNELSFEAALALARRADPSGKDYLVKEIDHLQSRDSYSIEYLCLLLEKDDFMAIKAGLEREIDERKAAVRYLEELVKELETEEEREHFKRRLAKASEPSDWIVERWLPLLGATLNREALPILLKYLDNDNHQARAGAARGLSYFDDDAVVEALVKRAPKEASGYVSTEIIKALGQTKNPTATQALIGLVEQPTLIDTKLAWIGASANLPAEQTKPILESWADTPDPRLANAVREALQAQE